MVTFTVLAIDIANKIPKEVSTGSGLLDMVKTLCKYSLHMELISVKVECKHVMFTIAPNNKLPVT